jgi:hypothetical protein
MTDTLTSALDLAAHYPVFPVRLCPDACLKCAVCKTPACSHGFKDASRDPKQIRELWREYPARGGDMQSTHLLCVCGDRGPYFRQRHLLIRRTP